MIVPSGIHARACAHQWFPASDDRRRLRALALPAAGPGVPITLRFLLLRPMFVLLRQPAEVVRVAARCTEWLSGGMRGRTECQVCRPGSNSGYLRELQVFPETSGETKNEGLNGAP
jgi:hypothetical protein